MIPWRITSRTTKSTSSHAICDSDGVGAFAEAVEERLQHQAGEHREGDHDHPQRSAEVVARRQVAAEAPAERAIPIPAARPVRCSWHVLRSPASLMSGHLRAGGRSGCRDRRRGRRGRPCSTMRPSSTTAISSTARSDDRRCATRTAVRPATRRSTAASTRSSVCRVEPARRFVEDHEPGVGEEDASEREQLRLARGQTASVRSEIGVETGGPGRQPAAEAEFVRAARRCARRTPDARRTA